MANCDTWHVDRPTTNRNLLPGQNNQDKTSGNQNRATPEISAAGGLQNVRRGVARSQLNSTGSRLMQAEKPGGVGRADGDGKKGAVDGELVGDRLPKLRGADTEKAFHREARVIGRPLESDFRGRGFDDNQSGRPEANCVG